MRLTLAAFWIIMDRWNKDDNLFTELFLRLIPYQAERITEENVSRVHALLSSNTDYFHATQPYPVSREDCIADITALPPGKSMADKNYLLLSDEVGDLAVIDFIEKYPDSASGYLGFFILANERHHQGIGKRLFKMLEEAARQCGLSRIELACFASNKPGLRFWKKEGYQLIRTSKRIIDNISYTILSLEKQL